MSKATCRTPHDEIGCLGRQRSRLKDCPVVALEDLKPGAEIIRMADGWCHPELSAQKRRTKLCNQLLARISLTAKPTREIAVET